MLSSANWKVYERWTCASGGYPAAKNIGKGVQQGTVTQYFLETLLEEGVAKTIQKPVSLLQNASGKNDEREIRFDTDCGEIWETMNKRCQQHS